MDRSNGNGAVASEFPPTDRKESYERPPRLRKKRSNSNVRYTAQPPPHTSAGAAALGESANVTPRIPLDFGKQRRGSVRNAVRRLFGRKSRDIDPAPLVISPPRHTYHSSEPGPLTSQPVVPLTRNDSIRPLALDPLRSSPADDLPRIGSPIGAFPNSGVLKPLDLRKPEIRRRKTLPNVTSAEFEAGMMANSPLRAPPIPPISGGGYAPTSLKSPPRMRSRREEKRRSRSADDLRTSLAGDTGVVRKRSEEIRYWRESFQPDVLRASGFVTSVPATDYPVLPVEFPHAELAASRTEQSFDTAILPPIHQQEYLPTREADLPSLLDPDTDMAKDLEDRVAKLEAGLHTFQRSLQRLTADRNRRTVVVDGEASSRRSAEDHRTPSMLADTLRGPFEYSSYEFEYGYNTMRPSTSPAPPATLPSPHKASSSRGIHDPFISSSSAHYDRPRPTERPIPPPKPNPPPPLPTIATGSSAAAGDQTFQTLYQMLADERSARRKLETQLRGLRQEISDLSAHVTSSPAPAPFHSRRSSYIPSDATGALYGSSAALREMLRETELGSSPPAPAPLFRSHHPTASAGAAVAPRSYGSGGIDAAPLPARGSRSSAGLSIVATPGMVSRFSGSESEAGATENTRGSAVYGEEGPDLDEELQTPLEAYRTPKEFGSRWTLRDEERAKAEQEMF